MKVIDHASAIAALVKELREVLVTMTAEERVRLLDELEAGYCRACGEPRKGICHCENDD